MYRTHQLSVLSFPSVCPARPATKILSCVKNPSSLWVYHMHSRPPPRNFLRVSKAWKLFRIILEDPPHQTTVRTLTWTFPTQPRSDLSKLHKRYSWADSSSFHLPSEFSSPLSCYLFISIPALLHSFWKQRARCKRGHLLIVLGREGVNHTF